MKKKSGGLCLKHSVLCPVFTHIHTTKVLKCGRDISTSRKQSMKMLDNAVLYRQVGVSNLCFINMIMNVNDELAHVMPHDGLVKH